MRSWILTQWLLFFERGITLLTGINLLFFMLFLNWNSKGKCSKNRDDFSFQHFSKFYSSFWAIKIYLQTKRHIKHISVVKLILDYIYSSFKNLGQYSSYLPTQMTAHSTLNSYSGWFYQYLWIYLRTCIEPLHVPIHGLYATWYKPKLK